MIKKRTKTYILCLLFVASYAVSAQGIVDTNVVEVKRGDTFYRILCRTYNGGKNLSPSAFSAMLDVVYKWAHHNGTTLPANPNVIDEGDVFVLPPSRDVLTYLKEFLRTQA